MNCKKLKDAYSKIMKCLKKENNRKFAIFDFESLEKEKNPNIEIFIQIIDIWIPMLIDWLFQLNDFHPKYNKW